MATLGQRTVGVFIARIDAITNAIRASQKNRDAHERRRLINETRTIRAIRAAAIFAFLTFIAAGISDWIFYAQLNTMREERRAWVGPVSAGFPNGLPQVDNPGTVIVQYHNTGREPAIDVVSDLSPHILTVAEDLRGMAKAKITEYVASCKSTSPAFGSQVVFPTTGFSSYTTGRVIESEVIDWNILYGTKMIFLTGCYVYNTLGVTRRTSFCFWFQNGPKMTPQSWAFCPTGNYAD